MNERELSRPEEADSFLQRLVNMVNKGGMEVSITLQVSGLLVSGMLVSQSKYFEGFSLDFATGLNVKESEKTLLKAFSRSDDTSVKHDPLAGYAGREPNPIIPMPSYIHLKNAKFFNPSGNPIPGNRGVWWRGRLSKVAGFILGTLSTEQT